MRGGCSKTFLWPKTGRGEDAPARTQPMCNELRRATEESRRETQKSDCHPNGPIAKLQQSFLSAVLCHVRAGFWPPKFLLPICLVNSEVHARSVGKFVQELFLTLFGFPFVTKHLINIRCQKLCDIFEQVF